MDRFYAQRHRRYYNDDYWTDFIFISNRLYKIIMNKAPIGEWVCPYWPLKDVAYDVATVENYTGQAISSRGTILFTKDF